MILTDFLFMAFLVLVFTVLIGEGLRQFLDELAYRKWERDEDNTFDALELTGKKK